MAVKLYVDQNGEIIKQEELMYKEIILNDYNIQDFIVKDSKTGEYVPFEKSAQYKTEIKKYEKAGDVLNVNILKNAKKDIEEEKNLENS